jgi:hypothetical protein
MALLEWLPLVAAAWWWRSGRPALDRGRNARSTSSTAHGRKRGFGRGAFADIIDSSMRFESHTGKPAATRPSTRECS